MGQQMYQNAGANQQNYSGNTGSNTTDDNVMDADFTEK